MGNFYIGQKVCCVCDSSFEVDGIPKNPCRDSEYTVKHIYRFGDGYLLALEEIPHFAYFADRFKPQTSLSVFNELLKSSPILDGVQAE